MTQQATATQTRADQTITDVPIRPIRTATYKFVTGLWTSIGSPERAIRIPYQIAFDGVVQQRHRGWPQRIVGHTEFKIQAPQNTRISLHLNTDSLEGARQHPVYEVTAGERDVYVTVTETAGSTPTTTATVTFARTAVNPVTGQQTDYYTAPLHGNIWARVSRVYTAADVEAEIPAKLMPESGRPYYPSIAC